MKIKITIEVIELRSGDTYKEVDRLLLLVVKGIIEKYIERLRGLRSNVYGTFLGSGKTTIIEVDEEEEKKIEV
jgi:hypothetical protein